MLRLQANDLIDPRLEANYHYHKKLKYWTIEHTHDFYELFLIAEGQVLHLVNGTKQLLSAGALVFLRPGDVHSFEKLEGFDVEMLNINYRVSIVDALFGYLGHGAFPAGLLADELPWCTSLDASRTASTKKQYEHVMTIQPDALEERRGVDRSLLAEWLIRYFGAANREEGGGSPDWLFRLCEEMKSEHRFLGGLDELYARAPVGQEHLCRVMRRQLGVSPTEWINELKLSYAANLLRSRDDSVSTIALEAGFNNLSHFHALFRIRFSLSPGAYRKQSSQPLWSRLKQSRGNAEAGSSDDVRFDRGDVGSASSEAVFTHCTIRAMQANDPISHPKEFL
ncbi:helix-turn-helix domain-containing protein [Paenibacillus koleovorans]|uniref:helix-turn-helix domain-containing protein n=1 Tax=Paenibacillus koleovorans TaxID=121608 RepID=UPI0013E3A4A1|nr:helix-turn-helix domain-containing protein [Paenibacillus koleovorans]